MNDVLSLPAFCSEQHAVLLQIKNDNLLQGLLEVDFGAVLYALQPCDPLSCTGLS